MIIRVYSQAGTLMNEIHSKWSAYRTQDLEHGFRLRLGKHVDNHRAFSTEEYVDILTDNKYYITVEGSAYEQ